MVRRDDLFLDRRDKNVSLDVLPPVVEIAVYTPLRSFRQGISPYQK